MLAGALLTVATCGLPSLISAGRTYVEPSSVEARKLVESHFQISPDVHDECFNDPMAICPGCEVCPTAWWVVVASTALTDRVMILEYVSTYNECYFVRSGWPIRCADCSGSRSWPGQAVTWRSGAVLVASERGIAGTAGVDGTALARGIAALPLRFEVFRTAANVVLWALPIWITLMLIRWRRAHRRSRLGLCVRCAYPVGQGRLCSECGTPFR